jgi:hypothetical protein
MQILVENKQQLLYLYVPMLIATAWGFVSHFLNWDDKHLDTLFAVYPLVGASSIFYFGFLHYKGKQIGFLIAGLAYLIVLSICYFYNILPIKIEDNTTVILLSFYSILYFVSIIVCLLNKKWVFTFPILIYNMMLISIIPFALLGYLTLVTSLLGLVYSFF